MEASTAPVVADGNSSPEQSAAHMRASPQLGVQDTEKKSPHAITKSALALHNNNHNGRTSSLSLEDISAGGAVRSSSHYWENGYDPSGIDGNLRRIRQYLRTARTLYEIQMQPKRPSAVLKMKANSFGFKNGSTHDVLANLVSPIRSPQVLDSWSPHEIGIFEDAFERFGKDFHAIAQQLPRKTVKDAIAFYYVWKKHGVLSVHHTDGEDSDGGSSEGYYDASMSAETLKLVEKLKRRQRSMRDYFAAARELTCVKRINQVSHRDVSLSDFSLHRLAGLRPAIPATSNLRNPAVLDTWTPHEIRVFELAMECYGKDEFHQVARMVGTKSCREVIAFYYVWKKDPYYKVVKSRWEKRDPFSKKKTTSTTATQASASQSGSSVASS